MKNSKPYQICRETEFCVEVIWEPSSVIGKYLELINMSVFIVCFVRVPQNNGFFEMFWSGPGLFNYEPGLFYTKCKCRAYIDMKTSAIQLSF